MLGMLSILSLLFAGMVSGQLEFETEDDIGLDDDDADTLETYQTDEHGTDGDDILSGDSDTNRISGHLGDDHINGYDGNDKLIGNEGDDTLLGGDGNDRLLGGSGDDTLIGNAGEDSLSGGGGRDFLYGSEGNDTLHGNEGDDSLHGQAGDDHLMGGDGNDSLQGGSGNDRLDGGAGEDTLMGGDGDDYLNGIVRDEQNEEDPYEGRDFLNGGDGDDTMLIGAFDVASGGDGADTFGVHVTSNVQGTSRITDFTPGEDTLMVIYDDSEGEVPIVSFEPHSQHNDVMNLMVDGETIAAIEGHTTLNLSHVTLMPSSNIAA
ncbi:MAG: calcium-binding protein [Halocynthiibacter sp.]